MKWIVLLCCVTAATCPLLAQQNATSGALPPTAAEVMKFYEVMHVRDQTQSLLDAQQKQIRIMIGDMFSKKLPDATAAQRKEFGQLMDSMIIDVFKDYPTDDILKDMVPVYQKHLTESDLNAVVAFYSSPVGQKLLGEMPAMMSEGMQVSYSRLRPRIEEMMKNVDARVQKMAEAQTKGKSTSK